MLSFFKSRHDVNAIVASFSETVAKLRAASEYHQDEADASFAWSVELRNEADRHAAERSRADMIAAKIEGLIGA